LSIKSFFLEYGEKVPGYDVLVVNEREARAAAGILGMLGTLVIFVGIGYNHIIVARVYLAFLWFDFLMRVINPRYVPSLLLAKFVVRNQRPEYVGAAQKRFAWAIGWMISFPMVYWFVLHWDITFYKVLVCVLCITLMFLESAFSICVGCWLYKLFTKNDPEHCPGGVCEVQKRDPIQIFSPVQKFIAAATFVALLTGTYLFLAKVNSLTFFGQFLHELVLTEDQLKIEKEEEYQRMIEREFGDDDDDDE